MFLVHSVEKLQLPNPQAPNPHGVLMLCDRPTARFLHLPCFWVPPSWGQNICRKAIGVYKPSSFLGALVTTLGVGRAKGGGDG